MNNDLISREALKKAFDSWKNMDDYYHDTDCDDIPLSEAYDLIDNAPTINPTITCKECDGYEAGYSAGQHDKRPQNEWVKIFENSFTNGYVCPFCGYKIQVTEQFLPKVTKCEGCGADMRGNDNG